MYVYICVEYVVVSAKQLRATLYGFFCFCGVGKVSLAAAKQRLSNIYYMYVYICVECLVLSVLSALKK